MNTALTDTVIRQQQCNITNVHAAASNEASHFPSYDSPRGIAHSLNTLYQATELVDLLSQSTKRGPAKPVYDSINLQAENSQKTTEHYQAHRCAFLQLGPSYLIDNDFLLPNIGDFIVNFFLKTLCWQAIKIKFSWNLIRESGK